MTTITIPQTLIKEKELVLIPRREYEKLLKKQIMSTGKQAAKQETKAVKRSVSFYVPKKHEKFYEKLDKGLTKRLRDYEKGKFVGPFSSIREMRTSLGK